LARWSEGVVADRRERRMALRLAAERAAIPAGAGEVFDEDASPVVAAVPEPAAVYGDDDIDEELFADDQDFYGGALEVLQ
jgi:hypothetical protein